MKTIVFSVAAAKDFDALPTTIQSQINADLDLYATTGQGAVKKLVNQPGYRLRSGRYRVIFDEDQTTVLAIRIRKRDDHTYS
jgi:mRNA interferase RelE/StbE